MTVDTIMSRNIVTVEMDDSLKVVKEIFDNTRFHHLLVVEAGKLIGIVSDRDLLKSLSPRIGTSSETAQDISSLNKKVHQIMTRNPISLTSGAGIFDAITTFNRNNISCLPVINEQQQPLGILSWRDILKTIEQNWEARSNPRS